jgi:hypothetical protein
MFIVFLWNTFIITIKRSYSFGFFRLENRPAPAKGNDIPDYNLLIENMVVEDNPAKLKQTKKSIKESGQKVLAMF